ncbi:hypothetical protein NMP99_07620 [Glutamicibacter mishrai]|uniref:alpha/beta hydrolase n=1 Tax=Glutamicibacter mishrai TaxID=1775880 RepID=UPI0020CE6E45|nr:hypothetical protein [Glutamicibacter mishrai]UTT41123.1 hypothetical protein NMP99_07620 [Glutamicibacter mishrai]
MGKLNADIVVQVRHGDAHARPWVLLHGTDGRETDLLSLVHAVAPKATTIAPRGTVKTPGGFAHFRRRPDRTLDECDIRRRVRPLADAIRESLSENCLDGLPVLVGYSNGAVMSVALLTHAPDSFAAAILLRPLTPYRDEAMPPLQGLPALVLDAANDKRRSSGDGKLQSELLIQAGAQVTRKTLPGGHPLCRDDERAIKAWLDALLATHSPSNP